jgi:uncharacterized damage-inducible protein DinB
MTPPGMFPRDSATMRKADIERLFDYVYWVTARLLDAAEPLSFQELTRVPNGMTRDLRATLVHELDVEWSWRLALQGRLSEATDDLDPTDYPNIVAIRERWRLDELEMRAWLDGLSDDELARIVRSELTTDERPLWQFLLHIVFHATQQQADAASLLTIAGRSPGDIGYLEMPRS